MVETLRNAYAAVHNELSFAGKEYRAGIYRAAGTATFGGGAAGTGEFVYYWPAIRSFVAENADALKAFVEAAWHNPTLGEIIDLIVRALS